MAEFRYDTYCGLYCGACDIMHAYRDGIATGRAPQRADLPARFRSHIAHAAIKCHGCKSGDVFAGCDKCPIRNCARKRGITGTCQDCKKYPCMLYWLFKLTRVAMRMDAKLPHWRVAPRNLATIHSDGIERWLKQQQIAWQCPDCGTPFSWYRPHCSKCGRDLEPLKDYNNVDAARP